ncbi:TPA: hypothetical protein QDE52_09915 [Burkholderia cenocepacia]|nr:hypothetical protein [Burkholderia cenocepacia]
MDVKIRDEGAVRNEAIYLALLKTELCSLPDGPILSGQVPLTTLPSQLIDTSQPAYLADMI